MNESAPQGEPTGCSALGGKCEWSLRCEELGRCCYGAAPLAAPLVAVPEGWKLVPLEPTQAMINAFHGEDGEGACNKWDAMLAATPPAPLLGEGGPQPSDEREAFETSMLPELMPAGRSHPFMERRSDGSYAYDWMQYHWEGWLARAALPLPAVVQAEPSDEQLWALWGKLPVKTPLTLARAALAAFVHPAAPGSPSAQARPLVQEQGESGQGELPVRAEMEKDAARYRWLRSKAARSTHPEPQGAVYMYFAEPQGDWPANQAAAADFDCAIDAAMSAPGGGGRA